MEKENIIAHPLDETSVSLPGTVLLPDGRNPIKLGSGTISSLINAGGMAIVYEIWNPELEVKRAVKLLKPDHTLESEDRFRTEMKITAKLHHPNIVEIYSVGNWNELPYIEMELIDGVTLEKLIEESGGLPAEVCTAIGIMVGRSLNYAHNQIYILYGNRYQGVIHRDIKPGNIMVSKDGVAKLMDFGIAKPVAASTRTLDGTVMGTMQYLAPEQLDGKEIDARTDLYSLGTVLYEILTGARAFPEEKLGKLVTDKLNNNYVPLTKMAAKVPSSLSGLVHHCLRYEKEKRVQNSLEFLREISRIHTMLTHKVPEQVVERFLAQKSGEKRIVSIRKKHPVRSAAAWAFTVAALIGATSLIAQYVKGHGLEKKIVPMVLVALRFIRSPDTDATIQTAPYSLPSRVDSVLALQKPQHNRPPVVKVRNVVKQAETRLKSNAKKRGVALGKRPRVPAVLIPAEKTAVSTTQERPDETNNQSLFDKLKAQLRTSDVMTMFCIEVEAGHFANALSLFKMLPADHADTKKARLYKMRALIRTDRREEIKYFFMTNDVYDGEFYLEKARWLFTANDFGRATEFVKRASMSPAQFLDSRTFRELLFYTKAQCASALFNTKATRDTKNAAMEAWNEVKSTLKPSPEHQYSIDADAELRRISSIAAAK
jgi:serine/threonine protein kinase